MSLIGTCSCADGSNINNFGVDGCIKGLGIPVHLVFVPTFKVDGTRNGINLTTDTLDQSFFDGKLRDPEILNRWFLFKGIIQYTSDPVDPLTEDFDDGTTVRLADGIRPVTVTKLIDDAFKLLAKIETHQCRNFSLYIIDKNSSWIGQTIGDLFLPREVQDNSLVVKAFQKTYTQANKNEISWNWDREAAERDIDYILKSSLGGFEIKNTQALSDVNILDSAGESTLIASTTSVTFSLTDDFGGAKSRVPSGGHSDLTLEVFNVTQDLIVVTTAFTEPTPGDYIVTPDALKIVASDVVFVRGITTGGTPGNVQLDDDLKRLPAVTAIAS